ncbi:MAG TPA: hypothetical protein IGS53_00640 [Leptolyngbyaceae cyanobacterium M33_DOE_097]|uniref:Uncharacterized protein n=1 Tax=Oscillatoriales cyanobacterium SpSt-418 TaxID=2282169 RepID=A0A7C3PFC8_9CYAN|nr:hypothetical protein [Leptolyngbyaceae cyanobacterium M33_DOE_097]
MKRLTAGLSVFIAIASLAPTAKVAQASFGDFMLGVGVTAGTSAIINANRRANTAEQRANEARVQQAVSPQEEFFRGLQDALNGLPYDNFRASTDYDEGFQEGLRRLQER